MMHAVDKVAWLKIELCELDPLVWRRVAVPTEFSLRRLHDVIQAVFDWGDYHLHQFEVGDRIYGQTEIAGEDFGPDRQYSDRTVSLSTLLARGVKRFVYRYDFGDDWEHIVTVERVATGEKGVAYPALMDGARRAPPEDCGGPSGFEAFLEAMADEAHEDHDDLLEWHGGPFDPDNMELEIVEAMLGRIRASRRKGSTKAGRTRPDK